MGQAAARNGLRNDLVGQVAPEPKRKRLSTNTGSPAGPTRRRTEGPGRERKSTAGSSRSSRMVRRRAGWNRGARRSRWSTRTTSPGGIASRKKSRSRARPRNVDGAAGELPDARRTSGLRQASAAPLAAGNGGPFVRGGPVHRAGSDLQVEQLHEHLPAPAELRRHPDRRRAHHACLQAPGAGEHDRRVHIRPRRVRRRPRHAR